MFLLSELGALEAFQWLQHVKPTAVSGNSGETYIGLVGRRPSTADTIGPGLSMAQGPH